MNANAAIEPWETFHAYRARAGFTAPGRPWHTLRFDRGRDRWGSTRYRPFEGGAVTLEPADDHAWRSLPAEARALPQGTAVFVDILDRDSDDVLALGVAAPRGLLAILRDPALQLPEGRTLWDWRAFAADPAVLDGVLAVYCTTGNVETALSMIEAARERGELD